MPLETLLALLSTVPSWAVVLYVHIVAAGIWLGSAAVNVLGLVPASLRSKDPLLALQAYKATMRIQYYSLLLALASGAGVVFYRGLDAYSDDTAVLAVKLVLGLLAAGLLAWKRQKLGDRLRRGTGVMVFLAMEAVTLLVGLILVMLGVILRV